MADGGDVAAIIVAAGEGRRLGKPIPKAFVPLGGKPMFVHSLEVFDAHPAVESVAVVAAPSMINDALETIGRMRPAKPVNVAQGGEHRCQSVHSGVLSVSAEWVMVHDAARPFVDAAMIDALLEKRGCYKCVIIGSPCVDTIRTFDGDRCTATIDRSSLIRVGTPQLFHRQTLLDAFSKAQLMENPPTDEAVLMERCGIAVGIAWTGSMNFKITTRQDLDIAEAVVAARMKL